MRSRMNFQIIFCVKFLIANVASEWPIPSMHAQMSFQSHSEIFNSMINPEYKQSSDQSNTLFDIFYHKSHKAIVHLCALKCAIANLLWI